MLPVLSREQMQAFDRFANERWHVPTAVLMENAGRGATEIIAGALTPHAPVVVVAGTGNNAGDGFVVARRLLVLGHQVTVALLGAPQALKGDAASNYAIYLALGGATVDCSTPAGLTQLDQVAQSADCVVDAIVGTGLDREVSGQFKAGIELVNRVSAANRAGRGGGPRVVSLDLPSGLEANAGRIMGAVIRADITVTFAHHKTGLLTPNGVDHCGEIRVVDIGVPARADETVGSSARLLQAEDAIELLTARRPSAHKGAAGKVVVFAGSPGKVGAALLVGQAALRAGAGLVTLAGFEETATSLDRHVQELMTARIDPERIEDSVAELCSGSDAVVCGPGLGLDGGAQRIVEAVLQRYAGPKVFDADALTHFSGRMDAFAPAQGQVLLTPHPGEMGRLLGTSATEVEADRFRAVAQAVEVSRAIVILKGPCTLIGVPGEQPVINLSRAPALATAGSGDVLAGTLAAFAATLPLRSAALAGVYAHSRAGEAWQAGQHAADRGLLAHEIADTMPRVIAELTQRRHSVTE